MSRFCKILWTVTSYCLLFLVITILLLVDYFTLKTITATPVWTIVFGSVSFLSLIGVFFLLHYVKTKVAPSTLKIVVASSKDGELMSSMVAYLLPLLTLVFNEINQTALICFLVIIAIMLLLTKALFINPILCFLGYKYYSVQAESGMNYTLITKQKRFNPKNIKAVIEIFPEIYLEVE